MEEKNKFVRMETSKGTITLELYAARAPKTVERFMAAVTASMYDGLKFHRIIKDFMVQGGDPQGTGMGGGNVKFEGSPTSNTFPASSAWQLSRRALISPTCSSSS
jgi:cyclophilin family peptidyl-prolyl cis-trans isomerase